MTGLTDEKKSWDDKRKAQERECYSTRDVTFANDLFVKLQVSSVVTY